MDIKYNVEINKFGEEYCVTPCPKGKLTVGDIRIMVGSPMCHKCRRFRGDDMSNKVVKCKDW